MTYMKPLMLIWFALFLLTSVVNLTQELSFNNSNIVAPFFVNRNEMNHMAILFQLLNNYLFITVTIGAFHVIHQEKVSYLFCMLLLHVYSQWHSCSNVPQWGIMKSFLCQHMIVETELRLCSMFAVFLLWLHKNKIQIC